MPNQDIRIELISDTKQLEEFHAAWEALWSSIPEARLTQHPAMCWNSDAVKSNPGRRFVVLAAWRGDRLIATFPLVTWSRLLVSFFATASGSKGYSGPMFAAGEDAGLLTQKMLGHLKFGALGAVIRLPALNEDLPFSAAVLKRKDVLVTGSTVTYEVRGVAPGKWDEHLASKNSSKRLSEWRRTRRQLSELGNVRYEEVSETSDKLATLDWLIETKREWLSDKQKKPGGFVSDIGYGIRRKQISEGAHPSVFCVSRILLNDKIIAAQFSSRFENSVQLNAIAKDGNYNKYAVGRILMEEVVKAVIEEKLNIDFGFGDNEYKKDFCNHKTIVYSADLLLGGVSLAIPAYRALLKYRGKNVAA